MPTFIGEDYPSRNSLETIRCFPYQKFTPKGAGHSIASVQLWGQKTVGFVPIYESELSSEALGVKEGILKGANASLVASDEPLYGSHTMYLLSGEGSEYRRPIYRNLPEGTTIKLGLFLKRSSTDDLFVNVGLKNIGISEFDDDVFVELEAGVADTDPVEYETTEFLVYEEWQGLELSFSNSSTPNVRLYKFIVYAQIPLYYGNLRLSIHEVDIFGNVNYIPIKDGTSQPLSLDDVDETETELLFQFAGERPYPRVYNQEYALVISCDKWQDVSEASDVLIASTTTAGLDTFSDSFHFHYESVPPLVENARLSAVITYEVDNNELPEFACLNSESFQAYRAYYQDIIDEINELVYPVLQIDSQVKPDADAWNSLFEEMGYTGDIPKEVTMLWFNSESETFGSAFRSLDGIHEVWNEYPSGATRLLSRDLVESSVNLYSGYYSALINPDSIITYKQPYHPFRAIARFVEKVSVLNYSPAILAVQYGMELYPNVLTAYSNLFVVPAAGVNYAQHHNFSIIFPATDLLLFSSVQFNNEIGLQSAVAPATTILYPYAISAQMFIEVVNLWDN